MSFVKGSWLSVIAGLGVLGLLVCKVNMANAQPQFNYATDKLWNYVSPGLSMLETSTLNPSSVNPGLVHQDGQGRGAYGLQQGAYQDVQKAYPYFQDLSWQDVTSNPLHYELASRAYADLMMKHLWGHIQNGLTYPQAFNELQKAWNLGAGGYDKGRQVVSSRQKKADKYTGANND